MAEGAKGPTKVFISYSWDSNEHKARVRQLADTLRNPLGIETDIDEYVKAKPPHTPSQGWDVWMEKRIEWAEFVLIVCTETYKRRFRGDEEPGQGRGVTWEGTIIRQYLYEGQLNNTKFIPIVFSSQDLAHVPIILNSNDKYVIGNSESLKNLAYRLRRESPIVMPEVIYQSGQIDFDQLSQSLTVIKPKDALNDVQRIDEGTSSIPSIEPPPVSLNITQSQAEQLRQEQAEELEQLRQEELEREKLRSISRKELQEYDAAKIFFIKNVNVKDPEQWAYSLDRMQYPESRVFELMWRAGSHGAAQPKTGDLMILHQRAKVTHVVEFLDDQTRQTDSGSFRWVRTVWIAEEDWNQLPHQREILGFSPSYSDGNTHYLGSSNFSTFREAWNSLEEFQRHVVRQLTQSNLTTTDEDNLASEKGVNYTRLCDLLKAGDWKAADKETADRMCEVMGRQREGFLRVEDIEQFPCVDLQTIDRLWVKYSESKFGFSVQKQIWQECSSPTEYSPDWEKFGDRVGWKKDENWIPISESIHIISVPAGHFPNRPGCHQVSHNYKKVFGGGWRRVIASLFARNDL